MTDQTTYQQLAARFDPGDHRTKTISGRDLTYVDGETVVSRLNDVLGFDGWSFEVGQINVLEKEVWVTGRLTVYTGDRPVVREQAGGQIINRNKGGEVIELGNDIKGAMTDCLKKCATLVGVGLYLFDPDARREVADEMRAVKRQGHPAPMPAAQPADPTLLKTKVELVADLKTGLEYARSLGLDPAEPDPTRMNRADIEGVIEALRSQCRAVLAERKKTAS